MSVNTILSSKITETGTEPVTLAQAKMHAAIDYTDYDTILPIYLSAARLSIEKATGLSLITKRVDITVELVANVLFKLPYSPVTLVNSIIGTLTNDDVTSYATNEKNVGVNKDFIIVDVSGIYDVQYDSSITSVAADLKLAIMQMFTFIFNHRGEYMEGKLDYAVEAERIIGQNTRFVI